MAEEMPCPDYLQFCAEPDPSCKDFIMQQTMMRIKDPKRSLDFYTRVLGMRLLKRLDFPPMKFSLYFVGYEKAEDIPSDDTERTRWMFSRKATVELTHNWGTENDPSFSYHNGNSEPRGFGHIGIAVSDVYSACERFEKLGVEFVKTPDGGKMKGLAFIKDPDGYWIEVLNPNAKQTQLALIEFITMCIDSFKSRYLVLSKLLGKEVGKHVLNRSRQLVGKKP